MPHGPGERLALYWARRKPLTLSLEGTVDILGRTILSHPLHCVWSLAPAHQMPQLPLGNCVVLGMTRNVQQFPNVPWGTVPLPVFCVFFFFFAARLLDGHNLIYPLVRRPWPDGALVLIYLWKWNSNHCLIWSSRHFITDMIDLHCTMFFPLPI